MVPVNILVEEKWLTLYLYYQVKSRCFTQPFDLAELTSVVCVITTAIPGDF